MVLTRLDLDKEEEDKKPKMSAQEIIAELNKKALPKLNRREAPYAEGILSFLRVEDLAKKIPLYCKAINPKIGKSNVALEAYLETNYGEKIYTFMNKYPATPYNTVGVKVGKHILQRFSENYVKGEDIEAIFQALLNIYHRFGSGKILKVEKKCLLYQDVIDDQALKNKIRQPIGKRLLCWVNNNESIDYAAAKGQHWGVEIRREAMAIWNDCDPTSRDRANAAILNTAAGLKRCVEEGANCKLLKSLGWSEEVASYFLNYAIWGVQQRWTEQSEEQMFFAEIEDGNGGTILVLKKHLVDDDEDEDEVMEEGGEQEGEDEVGGILQGPTPEECDMAVATARLALEDNKKEGEHHPGSEQKRDKYQGAVSMSNYYL
ncbi:hypothetical protein BDZ45DRAFT_672920 [Acephala macrosclerotiorum]|nr:hypothetical protein BDZ45DRAFT_672920 [Acephala macrosclerotiorum]